MTDFFESIENKPKKQPWLLRTFNKDIRRLNKIKSELQMLKGRTSFMQEVFDVEKEKYLEKIKQDIIEAKIREKKFNEKEKEPIKKGR